MKRLVDLIRDIRLSLELTVVGETKNLLSQDGMNTRVYAFHNSYVHRDIIDTKLTTVCLFKDPCKQREIFFFLGQAS